MGNDGFFRIPTFSGYVSQNSRAATQGDLKIGQFSRVKSPIIDLINTVESAVNFQRVFKPLKK